MVHPTNCKSLPLKSRHTRSSSTSNTWGGTVHSTLGEGGVVGESLGTDVIGSLVLLSSMQVCAGDTRPGGVTQAEPWVVSGVSGVISPTTQPADTAGCDFTDDGEAGSLHCD